MASTETRSVDEIWFDELKRGNDLTAELVRLQKDWKLALRQGMLTGLGSAVGATILFSILLWIFQPLKKLEVIRPTLDRIAHELESRPSSQH